jgi:hypothetical protein
MILLLSMHPQTSSLRTLAEMERWMEWHLRRLVGTTLLFLWMMALAMATILRTALQM